MRARRWVRAMTAMCWQLAAALALVGCSPQRGDSTSSCGAPNVSTPSLACGSPSVCCKGSNQETCVLSKNGPLCCPNDSTHEACPTTGSNLVAPVECCDLTQGACATNFFTGPNDRANVCCPSNRDCGGICCNGGTKCITGKCICEADAGCGL